MSPHPPARSFTDRLKKTLAPILLMVAAIGVGWTQRSHFITGEADAEAKSETSVKIRALETDSLTLDLRMTTVEHRTDEFFREMLREHDEDHDWIVRLAAGQAIPAPGTPIVLSTPRASPSPHPTP